MATLVPVQMQEGDATGQNAAAFDVDGLKVQAVAPVDADTGEPLDLATQTTLAALKVVADNLLTASNAIKTAAEGLNAKTTAVNTGAIAGTVSVSNFPSGGSTETTLLAVKNALDSLVGNTDAVETLQAATNSALTALQGYNDSVESLLTSLGTNTDGLEALLNTLGVQTDQIEPLLTAIEAKTPALEGGKLPVADSANAEISELTQEIRQLNETMLYLVSSLLAQQPRLDANNRAAVNVETGSVTVGSISTLTNMTNLNNFAGGNTALVPFYLGDAGATTIYDLIEVTH